MEATKKEYIDKLKKELDTIEVRYQKVLNENAMVGEDYRSRAYELHLKNVALNEKNEQLQEEVKDLQESLEVRDK